MHTCSSCRLQKQRIRVDNESISIKIINLLTHAPSYRHTIMATPKYSLKAARARVTNNIHITATSCLAVHSARILGVRQIAAKAFVRALYRGARLLMLAQCNWCLSKKLSKIQHAWHERYTLALDTQMRLRQTHLKQWMLFRRERSEYARPRTRMPHRGNIARGRGEHADYLNIPNVVPPHLNFEPDFFLTVQPANRLFCINWQPHSTYLINWYVDNYLSMSNHSIARSLFNLNLNINITRKKVALEIIAKRVVANICKSYKFSKRKVRAKTLLSSTNIALLLSSFVYIFSILSTIVAKSTIVSYTIYWDV